MKKTLFLTLLFACIVQANAQNEVESYIKFLKQEHLSPKEYIFKLFETADIVILGERDHRDTTQYTLILDIIADKRFIDDIGYIYHEIGVVNMTERANNLIKSNYSSTTEFNKAFVNYHFDDVWAPIWDKYNRYQFLKGLTDINKDLSEDKKITIGLTDMEFNWKGMTAKKYKEFCYEEMNKEYNTREQIMAANFIAQYEGQVPRNGRKKALLIVSREYAGKYDINTHAGGIKREASIIADKYVDRVKTVALNWYKWMPLEWSRKVLPNKKYGLSADGKWDAAFEATSHKPVGFDIKDTPFGTEQYDYDFGTNLKWQDAFDGYIFYKPFYEFIGAAGFPVTITNRQARQIVSREIIYLKAHGNRKRANLLRIYAPIYKYSVKIDYTNFRSFNLSSIPPYADVLQNDLKKWIQ